MTTLHTSFVPPQEIGVSMQKEMWDLYKKYYSGTSEEIFSTDLSSKSEVLLLHDANELVGFSTYELYDTFFEGKALKILYSGDTIVAKPYWGQQQLGYAWAKRVGEYMKKFGEIEFYWFLIVKGHRTYRYLDAFTTKFYPHWDQEEPDLERLAHALATEKFGSAFDHDTNIVHFDTSRGYLKSQYAFPTDRELKHQAVSYFIQANPHYIDGDELVCLCQITPSAFKPMTRRIILGK